MQPPPRAGSSVYLFAPPGTPGWATCRALAGLLGADCQEPFPECVPCPPRPNPGEAREPQLPCSLRSGGVLLGEPAGDLLPGLTLEKSAWC